MQNPLVIFVGAAIATLAALLGVTYDKWTTEPLKTEQTAVAPTEGADSSASMAQSAAKTVPAPAQTTGSEAASAGSETGQANQSPSSQEMASVEPAPQAQSSSSSLTLGTGTGSQTETPPDDSIPTFDTIRVETDGSAVMAGRGLPNVDVTVMLDGQALGSAKTDVGGAWVLIPTEPLPPGDHDLTLQMQKAGATPVPSVQSVAVKIPERGSDQALVVLNDPNQASKVLQEPNANAVAPSAAPASTASSANTTKTASASADTSSAAAAVGVQPANGKMPLALNTVDYNDKGDIIFAGNGAANATVRLYVDNTSIADAKIDSGGSWTFAGKSEIAPGTHTLRVDQLNADSTVTQRIELPFVRAEPEEVVALTKPAVPPSGDAATTTSTQPGATAQATETTAGSAEASSSQATANATAMVANTDQPVPDKTVAAPAADTVSSATSGAPSVTPTPTPTTTAASEPSQPTASQPEAQSTVVAESAPDQAAPAPPAAASAATPPAPEVAANQPMANGTVGEISRNGRVVIQPGNNLWQISRVIYGQGVRYTVIYQANKEQIRNPDLIYPGQIFATPGASPPEKIDPTQHTPMENAVNGTSSG